MIQQTDILTVDELADILKVTKGWIHVHARPSHPNPIPRMTYCGGLRFNWPDVAAWLETVKCGPTGGPGSR
jgi:hypothetical protein